MLKTPAWRLLNSSYLQYDRAYRRWHKLEAVDEFLLVKKQRYHGAPQVFRDGTELQSGDTVLALHFNNEYMATLYQNHENASSRRVVWSFGKALIAAMQQLHEDLATKYATDNIKAITGVTWFKTHGDIVGFESEPLPAGWRRDLLHWQFRLLLLALFPQLKAHRNSELMPHQFWLTPSQLSETVKGERSHVAKRFT
ncbi:YkoP family protein [Aliidiomarina maris]|uniref:YkoP-like domain-containing protein n=1 Tax=Aliidiomarina maris TaxID=531312 RepID=A0A327WR21_9GAMM|nr:hypothetical protein [Aliidiomarina maris]RAJ93292.1 hypothetical protein B0I24_12019 [Aliidiomarina maris]RUO18548.1 hypothetical protein CWE07_13695 [Aliidiomarina maris]